MRRLLFMLAIASGGAGTAEADVITTSLGNTTTGFNNGDFRPFIFDILNAQAGQPAPFVSGLGSDPIANGSAIWTFNYLPFSTVTAASIRIGIYDHDSASPGSQVALFDLDSNLATSPALTTGMDTLLESFGGGFLGQLPEYNEYALNLPAGTFADLADGMATFRLDLQGPVITPVLMPPPVTVIEGFNGYHLIFSTLDVTGTPVPEPSSLVLLVTGGIGLIGYGWRRKRKKAA